LFLHQAPKRGEDQLQLDGVVRTLLDTLSRHTRNMAVEKEGEKVTAKKEQINFEENNKLQKQEVQDEPQKQVEQLQEKLAVEQQKVEKLCEELKLEKEKRVKEQD
jgi:hypothetical protein